MTEDFFEYFEDIFGGNNKLFTYNDIKDEVIYYQMFEEGIFQLEFPELTGNYEIDMEIIKKLERDVN
jgi:hypothetical protein